MKALAQPFGSNMLGENALSQLEIMLAETHGVVKADLGKTLDKKVGVCYDSSPS